MSSASIEQPVWLPAGDDTLFGMLTVPTVPNGWGVLLHAGGFWIPGAHRNGVYVRLASALADLGFHVLRLDYHGVGESTGSAPEYRLDRPFTVDSRAALAWMRDRGLTDVVLVGSCFGARTALAVAPEVTGLRGLVLLAPPVRDLRVSEEVESLTIVGSARRALTKRVLRGLRDPARRRSYARIARRKLALRLPSRGPRGGEISPKFLEPLTDVVDRGVPVLFAFGKPDAYLEHFELARSGPLGDLLARGAGSVTVSVADVQLHGFTTLAAQDHVVECVPPWLQTLRDAERGRSPAGAG